MELCAIGYWTERYRKSCVAEVVARSENGNHATLYTVDITAEGADARLIGALRELRLIPEASIKDEQ